MHNFDRHCRNDLFALEIPQNSDYLTFFLQYNVHFIRFYHGFSVFWCHIPQYQHIKHCTASCPQIKVLSGISSVIIVQETRTSRDMGVFCHDLSCSVHIWEYRSQAGLAIVASEWFQDIFRLCCSCCSCGLRVFVSKADRKYPEIQCPASQSYLFVIHHDWISSILMPYFTTPSNTTLLLAHIQ